MSTVKLLSGLEINAKHTHGFITWYVCNSDGKGCFIHHTGAQKFIYTYSFVICWKPAINSRHYNFPPKKDESAPKLGIIKYLLRWMPATIPCTNTSQMMAHFFHELLKISIKMEYSFPMQSGQACSSHNSAWSLFFKSYKRKQIMRWWHCLLQSLPSYHHLQLLSEFLHLPLQGLVFMQFFFVISKD